VRFGAVWCGLRCGWSLHQALFVVQTQQRTSKGHCVVVLLQDKACAAVDEENASSPCEYETDEEWEEERKKKQADQLKEQVLICLLGLFVHSEAKIWLNLAH